MPDLNGVNSFLAAEKSGLQVLGTYTGTNKVAIQSLIDLISPESTTLHRGFLDQISPQAQRQLLVELDALKAAVEDVV